MFDESPSLFNNCLFTSIFVAVVSVALFYHFEDDGNVEMTFAMIKPDAFEYSEVIVNTITDHGFHIIGCKQLHLTSDQAAEFYQEHATRSFYPSLIEFMISGPVIVMQLE